MSASLLCRAVVLAQRRRLVDRARSHPLTAATSLVLACGLPIALLLSGRVLARELGPALLEVEIARAVVIGLALPCLAGGVVLALAADGGRSLGHQVLASPVTPSAVAIAGVALPGLACATVAVPLAAAGLLPLALEAPGGGPGVVALASTLAAAFLVGAACAEAVRSAWRGSRAAVGSLCVGAGALAGSATSPELAPVELTAAALAGARAPTAAIAVSTCLAILSAAALPVLVASRPPARVARRRSTTMGRSPWRAIVRAAAVILVRRADLRAGLVAGVALAVGAIVACRLTDATPPSGTLLSGTSMLIAAAPLALAVGGALDVAEGVWRTAPVGPTHVVSGWAVASLGPMLVLACAVATIASSVEAAPGSGVVSIAAIAVGTWVAGALAGVIVPWRPTGTGDQLGALAAFVVVAGIFSVVVALAGPRLEGLGAPGPIVAAMVLGGGASVAALALRRQLRGPVGARPA